jgi:lysozyme
MMLKLFERYEEDVYLDAKGLPTIGYGHLIKPGETFGLLTEQEASALLTSDIAVHEAEMLSLVSVALTVYQQDALASFVFNIGGLQFSTSTVRRLLNEGAPMSEVADQFTRWIKSGGKVQRGLIRRRNAEAVLFLGGGAKLIRAVYGNA